MNISAVHADPASYKVAGAGNPILPGYYADPSYVEEDGKVYIFATLDPWGGDTLGCWESSDFRQWTYRVLNWPTKKACTSATSQGAKVWAPSVVKGRDGKFYMYISVGSEVWAGKADHPLGPWKDALGGGKPLIPSDYKPGYHMIDAEAFIDDDGTAYLYWGSGLGWKNGKCWVVKLKPDMVTFDGEVKEVTPTNYFEGPFMVKHGGRYFLMYSQGITKDDTYQVHYAVGATPFGPFTEGKNSPILTTNKDTHVISPGHHAVFVRNGEYYILYHRHSIPFDPKFIGRQMCVDRLVFTADGSIEKVVPTHTGPDLIQKEPPSPLLAKAIATASGQKDELRTPDSVLDRNYATSWAAPTDAKGAFLELDLGSIKEISRQTIVPEYAWKPYRLRIEASDDRQTWKSVADFTTAPAMGSPLVVSEKLSARYIRLVFPESVKGSDIAIVEWDVR
ncbi:glycosyl hydrolase [Verrucomicrobia bacterium LW23]|nr:glycosyl hydrolase [Verrucomicrobia bacterium LW23]